MLLLRQVALVECPTSTSFENRGIAAGLLLANLRDAESVVPFRHRGFELSKRLVNAANELDDRGTLSRILAHPRLGKIDFGHANGNLCRKLEQAAESEAFNPIYAEIFKDAEKRLREEFFARARSNASQSEKIANKIQVLEAESSPKESVQYEGRDIDTSEYREFWPDLPQALRFMLAVGSGYVGMVRNLLDARCDSNHTDSHGKGAVHVAAMRGHSKVLRVLAESKCSLNAVDQTHSTAALYAAKAGHAEVLQVLGEEGCSFSELGHNGLTLAHECADVGHANALGVLAAFGCPMAAQAPSGWTAAHFVAWHGFIDALHVLHQCGCPMTVQCVKGATILHLAAQNGHHGVVSLALQLKCPVDALDSGGASAFSLAARAGQTNIARTLASAACKVDQKNNRGFAALHVCSMEGDAEMVRTLIECKADVSNETFAGHVPAVIAMASLEQGKCSRGPLGILHVLQELAKFGCAVARDMASWLENEITEADTKKTDEVRRASFEFY